MRYFIVDSLNLAYRAHNANFELKTSLGQFSGMFFGYVRTMLSLKKKYRGYKFIVVWDSKPLAKYALQADYKAGRSSMPESIMCQLDDLKLFLKSSGVDQYHMHGEEADDVIASLVETFKKEDAETIIIYSNDKDMLQLVETGRVVVYKPKVGQNEEKFYDEGAVIEKFGVPPSKLALYRSLDGDSSDNIIGIKQVPRKIMARIANATNTVGEFYAALEKEFLTEFQKKSFEEGRERVAINHKIVALNRSLCAIVCESSSIDKEKLVELFKKFEIRSMNVDVIVDIFSSSLNIRYTEARRSFRIESESLFS